MSYVVSNFYSRPAPYGAAGSSRMMPGWGMRPASAGPARVAVGDWYNPAMPEQWYNPATAPIRDSDAGSIQVPAAAKLQQPVAVASSGALRRVPATTTTEKFSPASFYDGAPPSVPIALPPSIQPLFPSPTPPIPSTLVADGTLPGDELKKPDGIPTWAIVLGVAGAAGVVVLLLRQRA